MNSRVNQRINVSRRTLCAMEFESVLSCSRSTCSRTRFSLFNRIVQIKAMKNQPPVVRLTPRTRPFTDWTSAASFSIGFPRFCTHDQFTCKSSKLCIPKSNLCDTITQCHDRSDEMSCSCPIEDFVTDKLFYRCGSTDKCLPKNIECFIKQECKTMLIDRDEDDEDDDRDDAECKHAVTHSIRSVELLLQVPRQCPWSNDLV